jgi:Ca2+-binding RTX toxin-like protein
MAFILGTSGNNVLRGGTGPDQIYGFGGSDTLFGNGSNDLLSGGSGNDSLYGGAGNDTIVGGRGADTHYFTVDSGNDVVTDLNPSERDSIVLLGVTFSDIQYDEYTNATTLYFTPEGNDPPGEDTVTFTDATEEDVTAALVRGGYDLI